MKLEQASGGMSSTPTFARMLVCPSFEFPERGPAMPVLMHIRGQQQATSPRNRTPSCAQIGDKLETKLPRGSNVFHANHKPPVSCCELECTPLLVETHVADVLEQRTGDANLLASPSRFFRPRITLAQPWLRCAGLKRETSFQKPKPRKSGEHSPKS